MLPDANQRTDHRKGQMSAHWTITRTASPARRNLFDLTPHSEHQIATIVSGSNGQLDRFERSLRLIEAAPELRECLSQALSVLNDFEFVQHGSTKGLRNRIKALLETLDEQTLGQSSEG
jgi:hypothetical protein